MSQAINIDGVMSINHGRISNLYKSVMQFDSICNDVRPHRVKFIYSKRLYIFRCTIQSDNKIIFYLSHLDKIERF